MLKVRALLCYGADLFLNASVSTHAVAPSLCCTYSCEDFLALELIQLRGRLLEVEARLVTRTSHVCSPWLLGEVAVVVRNQKSCPPQKSCSPKVPRFLIPLIAPWPTDRDPWQCAATSGGLRLDNWSSILDALLLLFCYPNVRALLRDNPIASPWSKTRTATRSQRYAQPAVTPESSACSQDVVQRKMDSVFAYGNGLLYVRTSSHLQYHQADCNCRCLCRSPHSRNVGASLCLILPPRRV